jgi:hypothetical protein
VLHESNSGAGPYAQLSARAALQPSGRKAKGQSTQWHQSDEAACPAPRAQHSHSNLTVDYILLHVLQLRGWRPGTPQSPQSRNSARDLPRMLPRRHCFRCRAANSPCGHLTAQPSACAARLSRCAPRHTVHGLCTPCTGRAAVQPPRGCAAVLLCGCAAVRPCGRASVLPCGLAAVQRRVSAALRHECSVRHHRRRSAVSP